MTEAQRTISARFGGTLGSFVLDVAFEAPMRGITAIFGPSGCGKTTVLRCIAGLNRIPGRLTVDGDVWQDDGRFLEPHQRSIGYVFQEASLFAHLSVRRNLRYGHRRALRRGVAESICFDEVVDLLGIGHLLDRATGDLSGGERQRVALGRALLSQPRLLLMDEPLSALDRMTKDEILPYFEALRSTLSIPILYVSHDISEIERIADHMVLLETGRVLASGPLQVVLTDMRLPVARGYDASTVLEATIGAWHAEDALTAIVVDGETLMVPRRLGPEGGRHRVRIAATDISLAVEPPSQTTIVNVVPVRILDMSPLGEAQVNVLLGLGHRDNGPKLLARITRRAQRLLALAPGQEAYAQIKAVSLIGAPGP